MPLKLLFLKGLPASGKTTYAKELVDHGGWVRVNKDDIRLELGEAWSPHFEKRVLRIRDDRIRRALATGKDVISDDTNFAKKHEFRLRELAKEHKAVFEVRFFDVPVDECVRRDELREVKVGEEVIRGMYNKYLAPKVSHIPTVFIDLDGVLADFDGFYEKNFNFRTDANKADPPDLWDNIKAHGSFFRDLPLLPNAYHLWDSLTALHVKPVVLTGIPSSVPKVVHHKTDWVAQHFGADIKVICCRSKDKYHYGKSGDILIDDRERNRKSWEDMGGRFILYKSVEDTVELVKKVI